MFKFVKDLFLGEPAIFVGIVSTGLTSWLGALTALDQPVPLALAIATPVWVAVGAFYIRSKVSVVA